MSETLLTTQTTLFPGQLPILPEKHSIDPIVQCGVLYLGSAPAGAGLRELDAIQEPFSHRYPVDGTNTVRGIDAVLSVYDNGFQIAFTRQPHAVVFYPINSLIYCGSLRFTVIENDQTKPQSVVDWRFMPLDAIVNHDDKHPPLFCAVVQRTQFLPGEECHCFITKSIDAAIALVTAISQAYANVKQKTLCSKSPVFYQLDRYGRKLSEITGVIYISPANDDNSNRILDESSIRNYLFDPVYDGFFYRTDASLIEQWQLWDDNDLNGSRPRPPASPFGLHEGIYHDDTTHEIQRYLRRMEDEEEQQQQQQQQQHSCTCSYSTTSTSSSSSLSLNSSSASPLSTEYSHRDIRSYSNDDKSIDNDETDQFDPSLINVQTSTFEPFVTQTTSNTKKSSKKPIIIEKVVPKPVFSIPILNPKLPELPLDIPDSIEQSNINRRSQTDYSSFEYRINERGEKITKEGNRIVFMDVIQMDNKSNYLDSQIPIRPKLRSHSHKKQRASRHIPVINMETIEELFHENIPKNQRHTSIDSDQKIGHSSTADKFDTIDQYLKDYHENQMKLTELTIQSESSATKKEQQEKRKSSIASSNKSSKNPIQYRQNQAILTAGPSVKYVEHPLIPSLTSSQVTSRSTSQTKGNSPKPSVLTDEKLNEYLSNIYGTSQSIKSNASSISHQEDTQTVENPVVTNIPSLSAFRYMQSSINRRLLDEYRNAY